MPAIVWSVTALLFVVIAALFLAVKLIMTVPVASAEQAGPLTILKRGWKLTSGHYWTLFAVEILLLVAALVLLISAQFVGGAIAQLLGDIEPFSLSALVLALFMGAAQAVFTVLAWIALSYVAPRFGVPRAPLSRRAPGLALVLAIDFAFFVLAGAALRALHPSPDTLPFGAWCGWLSLAWMVGYVTPGAPAGIGLREAVLALGLSPALGESEALVLALLYRLITTVTDGVLAALGFLSRRAA